jgi:NADPH-dependent 2,4-dienoyl-CoA reductase/sulfur reductase-like enzyme
MIRSACESAKNAVINGRSFIGVELAAALRENGKSVKLVLPEDFVWQNLMLPVLGEHIMGILEEHGVEIFPREVVFAFGGSGELAESVVTADGSVFEADAFGVGTGIRPNTGFLEGSGIETSRGVLVDSYLETNVKGVFAAWDVAEFEDVIIGARHLTGHIENAQQQGKATGRNWLVRGRTTCGSRTSIQRSSGHPSSSWARPATGTSMWPGEAPKGPRDLFLSGTACSLERCS